MDAHERRKELFTLIYRPVVPGGGDPLNQAFDQVEKTEKWLDAALSAIPVAPEGAAEVVPPVAKAPPLAPGKRGPGRPRSTGAPDPLS